MRVLRAPSPLLWFEHPSPSDWLPHLCPSSLGLPSENFRLLYWVPFPANPLSGLNLNLFHFLQRFFSPDITELLLQPNKHRAVTFPPWGQAVLAFRCFFQHRCRCPFLHTRCLLIHSVYSDSKSLPSKSLGDDRHVSRCLLLETFPHPRTHAPTLETTATASKSNCSSLDSLTDLTRTRRCPVLPGCPLYPFSWEA